jgi:hypothetical protein
MSILSTGYRANCRRGRFRKLFRQRGRTDTDHKSLVQQISCEITRSAHRDIRRHIRSCVLRVVAEYEQSVHNHIGHQQERAYGFWQSVVAYMPATLVVGFFWKYFGFCRGFLIRQIQFVLVNSLFLSVICNAFCHEYIGVGPQRTSPFRLL